MFDDETKIFSVLTFGPFEVRIHSNVCARMLLRTKFSKLVFRLHYFEVSKKKLFSYSRIPTRLYPNLKLDRLLTKHAVNCIFIV